MWLVERKYVGAVAYGRMQRDGAIRTVIPGLALPHDVPDSPAVRRAALQRAIPAGCQVTGLGVLWASGYSPLPTVLDVRTALGRHVRNWRETIPLEFHAVGTWPEVERGTGFIKLGAAMADALRWAPLELAVPSVLSALGAYTGQARTRIGASVVASLGGDLRGQSAWTTIQGVLKGGGEPNIGAAAVPDVANRGAA